MVTDNGSEYVNEDLAAFFSERGIIHEKSVAYVAEQNGYIERDIRTIKESAKTMLNKSGLDKNLWPEAVNCAIHTVNRVVNSSNQLKTPYEGWFKKKPSVKNLRIFGEVAIVKKPDRQVTGSWDQKGKKAIFIGYTDRANTYRFLVDNNIVIACDVVFLNQLSNSEQLHPPQGGDREIWCV